MSGSGLALRAVARSHVGLVRTGNEDSGYAGDHLFVVADGMGGSVAGEVASRTVVAALLDLDADDSDGPPAADGAGTADVSDRLRAAVAEANARLRLAIEARPDLDGMGTTLTALAWDGDQLALAHVGDSRAYLMRDGTLHQLTRDQTLVQALIDEGRISESDARTHPQRAVILQALDGRADVHPVVQPLDPQPGDRYLVCSDGLTGYVDETDVRAALERPAAADAADTLVALALAAGAPDNVTVVLVDVTSTDAAPSDRVLVGAVGDTVAGTAPAASDTATTRPDAADDGVDGDEPPHGRRRRWWLLAVVAALVVLAVGAGLAYRWSQDQWYVGAYEGNVAVFTGVELDLGPVDLSALHERSALEVAALPEFAREEVERGIPATDAGDAQAILARLQEAAASCLSAPDTAGCP